MILKNSYAKVITDLCLKGADDENEVEFNWRLNWDVHWEWQELAGLGTSISDGECISWDKEEGTVRCKEELKATNVASDWLDYSILFVYTVKN